MSIDQMSRRREEAEIRLALRLSSTLTHPAIVHPTTDSSTTHPPIAYTPSIVPDTFSSSFSASSSSVVSSRSPTSVMLPPIRSAMHSPAISVGQAHGRPSPYYMDSPIGAGGNILSTLPPGSTLAREIESGFDVWDGPPGHPYKLDDSISSLGGRSEKAMQSSGERSYQEEDRMHNLSLQSLSKPGGVTWSSSSRETSSNPKQFSSLSTFTPNPAAGPSYHPSQDPTLLLSASAASAEFSTSSVSSAIPSPSPNTSTPYPYATGISQIEVPTEGRARPKPKPRMIIREKSSESVGASTVSSAEVSMRNVEDGRDWPMGSPSSVVPSSRAPSGLTPEDVQHTPTLSPLSARSVTPTEHNKGTTLRAVESAEETRKLSFKRKNRDLSIEEEDGREDRRDKKKSSEPRERKHSNSTNRDTMPKAKDDRTKDRRRDRDDAGDDESDPLRLSSSSKKSSAGKMVDVIDLMASSEPGDIPRSLSKSKPKTKDLSRSNSDTKSKTDGKGKEAERRSGTKSASATPSRSLSSSSSKAARAKRPMMVPSSPSSTMSEPEAELKPAPIPIPQISQPQTSETPVEGRLSVPHMIDSQSPSLSPPPPLPDKDVTKPNPQSKVVSDSTATATKKSKKKGPPKGYAYETDEDEPVSRPVLAPASVWIDEHPTSRRGKNQVSYQEIPPDEIDERLMEIKSSGTGSRRSSKRQSGELPTDEGSLSKKKKKEDGDGDGAGPIDQTDVGLDNEELVIVTEGNDLEGEVPVKAGKGVVTKKAPAKKGKAKGKGKGKASAKDIELQDESVDQEEDMIEVEKEEEGEVKRIDPETDSQKVGDDDEKKDSSVPTPASSPPPAPAITAMETKPSLKRSQSSVSSSSNPTLIAEGPKVSIPRHHPPFKREGSATSGFSSPRPGKGQSGSEIPRSNSLASIIHKHSTPLRSPSIQTSGLVRPSGLSKRHRIAPLHHSILPQPKKLPPPPVKKVAKKKGDLCEDDFSEGEWEEMEKERLKRERDWEE